MKLTRTKLIKLIIFVFATLYMALMIDKFVDGDAWAAVICGILGLALAWGGLLVKGGGDDR